MRKVLIGWFGLFVVACGSGGGASDGGTGGGTGGSAGTGGGTAMTTTVNEAEPNDGPTLTGMQNLGTFTEPKTIVVKGKLATGGNDGTKYTGDYDGVVFDIAQAGGSLGAKVEWTGSADVDMVVYDANLAPVYQDGQLLNPIVAPASAAPAGKFAIVLFSKDVAADWTMTITYTRPMTGSGGNCNSTVPVSMGGGCTLSMIEPLNGQQVTLPVELGVNSCGCETPLKIHVYGNPPTAANSYNISKTRGTNPICSWTARTFVTQADLTQFGITSDNGVYHWQVVSFHGHTSESRTFTLAPAVCK